MGGAFVGVANDPSSIYWNPSGVPPKGQAAGGATVDWVRFQTGDRTGSPAAGPTERESTFYSFGGSQFALSYGKLQTTSLGLDPQGALIGETLATSQFGATILQSIANGVIVGTTLKLLHGFGASAPVTNTTVPGALSDAEALTGQSVTKFDYDVGVMAQASHLQFGVTLKNLQEPQFPTVAGTAIVLRRQARFGLAVLPTSGLTLAMDLDLDKVDLLGGLRRMIAFGGEGHLGHSLAVRGGIRWSLVGERQRAASVGASFQLKKGYWLDGQYTKGDLDGDHGFGVSLRAGF